VSKRGKTKAKQELNLKNLLRGVTALVFARKVKLAALLQNAKIDKEHDDSWKVKRAMRNSWISQMKALCKTALPRTGMRVFGYFLISPHICNNEVKPHGKGMIALN
jgi:hypothetical protein